MKNDIEVTNGYTSMLIDVTTEFTKNGFHFCQAVERFKAKHYTSDNDDIYDFGSIHEAQCFINGFTMCAVMNGFDNE